MRPPRARTIPLGAYALALAVGCATGCAPPDEQGPASQEGNITSGTEASHLPEAVLLGVFAEGVEGRCSGALIAPRVVLTAGHCVHGFTRWTADAPYAGGQHAEATRAAVFDWNTPATDARPDMHDIGLVLLDAPITLGEYPDVASSPELGEMARYVGRVHDGEASDTDLFMSAPTELGSGEQYGWPFTYATAAMAQPGDSGGPIVLADDPHLIVAVDSGGNGQVELGTRTDLVAGWIAEQVAAHGP